MRGFDIFLRLACLLPGILVAPMATAAERTSTCPAIVIDSSSASDRDRELVCAGAASAREFLHAHGIAVRRRIRLELHDEEIAKGPSHIGLYDATTDRIDLLSYAQARRLSADDPLFGVAMTPALYESVIVHEVSHAIVEQNLSYPPDSRVVHEYIAYAAQLATMAPDLRRNILQRYHQPGYSDVGEMSWVYYQLDPSAFGVKVYRHFRGLADPSRFLHALLNGTVRPPAERSNGM